MCMHVHSYEISHFTRATCFAASSRFCRLILRIFNLQMYRRPTGLSRNETLLRSIRTAAFPARFAANSSRIRTVEIVNLAGRCFGRFYRSASLRVVQTAIDRQLEGMAKLHCTLKADSYHPISLFHACSIPRAGMSTSSSPSSIPRLQLVLPTASGHNSKCCGWP
jgi:hypothetical protein